MQVAQRGSAEPLWTAIGQTSNQLILYHPPSHALSVQSHSESEIQPVAGPSRPTRKPLLLSYDSAAASPDVELCPYCSQALPSAGRRPSAATPGPSLGKTPYFRILERAHEGSRPPSPRLRDVSLAPSSDSLNWMEPEPVGTSTADDIDVPSRGYYERFFREEKRLGMGAEGSVYLATHVIGGNVLGTYAVKKIAVGESKDYLVRMLHEVRLLEALRHPNIIPYHHSWIEPTTFSTFGPPINALHVLMMYATAGNLDTFLLTRTRGIEPTGSAGDLADAESLGQLPKEERIKAFRKRRASGVGKKEENRGVLMLGLDEVLSLFGDVVEGLAFLHSNSILHLDLKCSNVLLHWEDGVLIPKAMISDFGTSEEMLLRQRQRTGHTGTMEYMAPETLVIGPNGQWRPSDSHGDMWSLGLILHKLLFLHLPYAATTEYEQLEAEIISYPGFNPSQDLINSCERRHIPRSLLLLLSNLVCVDPNKRPTAEKVKAAMKQLRMDPPNTGIGRSGAIVKRGFKGLAGVFSATPASGPDLTAVRSSIRWEDDWQMSPVRSMPARPHSPTHFAFISTPPPSALPLCSTRTVHMSNVARKYEFELRAVAFILKVMSVQPMFIGAQSPLVVLGLVMLALYDLRGRSGMMLGAAMAVHIAVLYAAWPKLSSKSYCDWYASLSALAPKCDRSCDVYILTIRGGCFL